MEYKGGFTLGKTNFHGIEFTLKDGKKVLVKPNKEVKKEIEKEFNKRHNVHNKIR